MAVAKAEGLDAVIDRDAKTVTVSFDASFSRGTVIVMAYDLADNVIVKPLFYKAATLGTVAISTPDQDVYKRQLLCGANAVQICSAIHEKGCGVIVDINRFIDLWAERHGFESLAEFRGKMNYGNAESSCV